MEEQLLEKFLQELRHYRPDIDLGKINAVLNYLKTQGVEKRRKTGDTYLNHILESARILLPLKPDNETVVAVLMHDIAHFNPEFDEKEFVEKFGENVLSMIKTVNSLSRIKSTDQKSEVESFRKMFMVMAKDVRVVIIKMADRLHNLVMLEAGEIEERRKLAKQTMDIYVPVSSRLGIYSLKTKLEDISFKYLYPDKYENLKAQMDEFHNKNGKGIEEIKKELIAFLHENGYEAKVDGRVKNLYSIYRKLKLKSHASISDIYDVFAMRVILPDKINLKGQHIYDHLYAVLGLIHSKWTPLSNRFKDYVAVPKSNGYKSLHTAVVGFYPNSNQATEIQIRTKKMHEQAEFGVASHWLYEDTKKELKSFSAKIAAKDGQSVNIKSNSDYTDWVSSLDSLKKDESEVETIHMKKLDMFSDRIFVFTPRGDVKDLPKGATPIDFAYAIHSDVGNHCQVVKVNGAVVPLDYELQNGEVVEIVVNNRVEPKPHWLAIAKTVAAKAKIRSALKDDEQDQLIKDGKEIVNKLLEKHGEPLLDDDLQFLKEYKGKQLSLKDRFKMLQEIGKKTIVAATVVKNILAAKKVNEIYQTNILPKKKTLLPTKKDAKVGEEDIYVAGMHGLPFKLGNCCKPKIGHPIVAYLTRGRSLSIHKNNCKFVNSADKSRVIEASWGKPTEEKKYSVKLWIKVNNRVGLIRDIADVISSMNINIVDFGTMRYDPDSNKTIIFREMVLEVTDDEQLHHIIGKLNRVMSVLEVGRA